MKKTSFLQIVGASLALLSSFTGSARAVEILKGNNTTTLNATGSWVGGVVPGSSDIAVWDSTVGVARSAALGGNLTWQGIKVTGATGLQSITTTVGAVLDLGSSGIDLSASNTDMTISAVMNFSGAQTWSIASGRTLTIAPGTGIANTGSANILVTGPGNLRFGNGGGTTTPYFGTGGVTLGGGVNIGSTVTTGRAIANAVTLDGTIGVTSTATTVGSGSVSGGIQFNGGIAVSGSGQTINLSSTTGTAFIPTIAINSAVTGGNLTINNVTTGTAPIQSVVLSSTAGISGLTLGSGVSTSILDHNLFTSASKLTLDAGSTLQLAKAASASTYSSVTYSQVVGSLNGAGTITSDATGVTQGTLTVNSTVTNVDSAFSGTITDGTSAVVGLAKAGSRTLTLSGSNSYTGTTAVNAGTLLINGSHSGTGAITVANGATFGRTGSTGVSLGSNVTFGDGSLIMLTLGAALANSSLDRTAGTWAFDANQAFNFDLTGAVTGNYTGLITGLVGTEAGLASISTWTISNAGAVGTFSYNAGSVDLNLTAIPEPSTWALLAAVGTFFVVTRRRRRTN